MLNQYVSKTRNLLQLPTDVSTELYTDASLTLWINQARGQLAGEGECIRTIATIPTLVGQRPYAFFALNTGVSASNGIQGAIHVRRVSYAVGAGEQWITPRPWPWFEYYALNNLVPENGPPAEWSQYWQGAAGGGIGNIATGSFYLDPPPDAVYTLRCDCVCYPIDLETDSTVEAIPYFWTDCVPYYAAYLALMSAQTSARIADAERLFNQYQTFMERARRFSNPSVLRWQYEGASDPTQAAKIGLKGAAG